MAVEALPAPFRIELYVISWKQDFIAFEFTLKSFSDPNKSYNVTFRQPTVEDIWICTCPNFQYASNNHLNYKCKHIKFVENLIGSLAQLTNVAKRIDDPDDHLAFKRTDPVPWQVVIDLNKGKITLDGGPKPSIEIVNQEKTHDT